MMTSLAMHPGDHWFLIHVFRGLSMFSLAGWWEKHQPAWSWRKWKVQSNPVQQCSGALSFLVAPQKFNIYKNWWASEKVYNKTSRKNYLMYPLSKFQGSDLWPFFVDTAKGTYQRRQTKNVLHLHGNALGPATNGALEGLLPDSPLHRIATTWAKRILPCAALVIDLAVATLSHTHSVIGALAVIQCMVISFLTPGLHQVVLPHQDTPFRKLLRSDMCLHQLLLFGLQLLDECIVFSQSSCNCCLFICHVSNGNGCIAILLLPGHIASFHGRHWLRPTTRQRGRISNLVGEVLKSWEPKKDGRNET